MSRVRLLPTFGDGWWLFGAICRQNLAVARMPYCLLYVVVCTPMLSTSVGFATDNGDSRLVSAVFRRCGVGRAAKRLWCCAGTLRYRRPAGIPLFEI